MSLSPDSPGRADQTRPTHRTDRRHLLKSTLAAAAGAILLPALPSPAAPVNPNRRRVLRFAHLTDIHVKPENKSPDGMTACLRHVMAQADKPELIINGGDAVMDAYETPAERAAKHWALFTSILKAECPLPVEHCIGNHDIHGWNKEKSKATGDEPHYGKRWALDVYQRDKPYKSFDRAGWHFILLDSIQPASPTSTAYRAMLDDAQFEWLTGDLAATPSTTPICVVSHAPILGMCPLLFGNIEKEGRWNLSGGLMHIDARKIKDLFHKHPNVKLALSGHIHLVDRVEYLGVTYCCNGAVSAAWWGGPMQEFENGYALVNLYDDGTFDNQYTTFGWKAPTTKPA